MIEVEIKCQLQPEQERKIIEAATFVSQERLVDVYYDLPKFDLAARDWWLRTRNGQYLLKIPEADAGFIGFNTKPRQEIEDVSLIKQKLGLEEDQRPLAQALESAGYTSFFTLNHDRRKYRIDAIVIDIDRMDLGDFTFEKCEFELMVTDKAMVKQAHQQLCDLAHQFGIATDQPVAKLMLIDLIRRTKPDVYQRLMQARAKLG